MDSELRLNDAKPGRYNAISRKQIEKVLKIHNASIPAFIQP